MCGIIGQLRFSNEDLVKPEIKAIEHRGPDGQGEWQSQTGKVYLGHTRLAILDLSPAGRQPMKDTSGRFHITFNGEIYNHLALRNLLPDLAWRGTSDTETLVELFALKGLAMLNDLNGMFAFALHDANDDSVLLARDRLGIKPLWYHADENAFSFSSETRALMFNRELRLNRKALGEYIAFGRMPEKVEVFNSIKSLEPGGWIRVAANGKITSGTWWPAKSLSIHKFHDQQNVKLKIKELVTLAAEEHLISDVGVGSFLSGGIDSSIVTLVAGQKIGRDLKTFTIGFPESSHDERAVARIVAKKAGTDHHELEITEEDSLNWVVEAVQKFDLPSVDAINTYIVSKAVTSKGLKVALSGLGGDELFGGYPSFRSVPYLTWLGVVPRSARQTIINLLPANVQQKLEGLPDYAPCDLAIARRRFISVSLLKKIGFDDSSPEVKLPPMELDTMGQISWAEFQGYMTPMLLRDSDQMSMATGLEIRVPFLDHRLVEEVLNLPEKFKKGSYVKSLLVDAFKAELPPEVYRRKKQGFVLPMENWIRKPLAQFTREGVQAAADFLRLSEPLTKLSKFEKGELHWARVWIWCILGHWLLSRNPKVEASSLQSLMYLGAD